MLQLEPPTVPDVPSAPGEPLPPEVVFAQELARSIEIMCYALAGLGSTIKALAGSEAPAARKVVEQLNLSRGILRGAVGRYRSALGVKRQRGGDHAGR
jgi:hypothetical protein